MSTLGGAGRRLATAPPAFRCFRSQLGRAGGHRDHPHARCPGSARLGGRTSSEREKGSLAEDTVAAQREGQCAGRERGEAAAARAPPPRTCTASSSRAAASPPLLLPLGGLATTLSETRLIIINSVELGPAPRSPLGSRRRDGRARVRARGHLLPRAAHDPERAPAPAAAPLASRARFAGRASRAARALPTTRCLSGRGGRDEQGGVQPAGPRVGGETHAGAFFFPTGPAFLYPRRRRRRRLRRGPRPRADASARPWIMPLPRRRTNTGPR